MSTKLLLIRTTELNRTIESMKSVIETFALENLDNNFKGLYVANKNGANWEIRSESTCELFRFVHAVGLKGVPVMQFDYNFNSY